MKRINIAIQGHFSGCREGGKAHAWRSVRDILLYSQVEADRNTSLSHSPFRPAIKLSFKKDIIKASGQQQHIE